MALTIAEEENRFVATFHGNTTPFEIEWVWELLAEGVGLGLIDFTESTGFTDLKAIERVVEKAKQIPSCRLAFLCPDALAFGNVRVLLSFSESTAGWNVFRNRESALVWLGIFHSPLLAA